MPQSLKARYGLRATLDKPTEGEGDVTSSQIIDDGQGDQRPLSDYLVGHFLNDALARDEGETIDIYWPFEDPAGKGKGKPAGTIDWRGREAILYVPEARLRWTPLTVCGTSGIIYSRISSVNLPARI